MTFSTSDTIVAVATPPGRGGIGVVRLSGPDAYDLARRLISHDGALAPRRATFTTVRQARPARNAARDERECDRAIDQVIATYFPAPRSYTGDDVVELSAHGNPVVLRAIVATAVDCGARLAEPGEFTLRAFLNGRIDLPQAEAVADLIDAVTPLQARAAFDQLQGTLTQTIGDLDRALFDVIARLEASVDFPDEGYHFVEPGAVAAALDALIARTDALLAAGRRGRLVREGVQVAIAGAPNVGKSSLFNALAGASRAIVASAPGTTRDLVTEVVDLDGLRVTLVDTAGLRESDDAVEAEGVDRARRAQAVADLVLLVLDRSQPQPAAGTSNGSVGLDCRSLLDSGAAGHLANVRKVLCVANKSDLPPAWRRADAVEVSAATGEGLDDLRRRIAHALDVEPLTDRPEITNDRHIALVGRARDALARARAAARGEDAPAPRAQGSRRTASSASVILNVGPLSEEFVLADLQDARAALEEILGRRTPEDVLAQIFSRFCVGK